MLREQKKLQPSRHQGLLATEIRKRKNHGDFCGHIKWQIFQEHVEDRFLVSPSVSMRRVPSQFALDRVSGIRSLDKILDIGRLLPVPDRSKCSPISLCLQPSSAAQTRQPPAANSCRCQRENKGRGLETLVIYLPWLVAVSCEVWCQADRAFMLQTLGPFCLDHGVTVLLPASLLNHYQHVPGLPSPTASSSTLTHYPLSLPPMAICLFLFSFCPSPKAEMHQELSTMFDLGSR